MYLVKEDGSVEDLDIKTTRSIWGIEDKKEAIKKLYEGQGKDRQHETEDGKALF